MTLASWLQSDRFDLALSSGFFGFYAHAGFLKALEEKGIRPSRISGSSAGALVGACFAAGLSGDELREELFRLKRADFWDPAPGFGLLRGRKFHERLQSLLPVKQIEDCPIPLSISVFDSRRRRTLTLTTGCLPTAIRASCAFPFLFHPVRIAGTSCLDGGIADGPGLAGVESQRVLYHHLPSTRVWGRLNDRHSSAPRRPGLHTIIPVNIPPVGPFRMEQGKVAFQVAYDHAVRAFAKAPEPRADSL